MNTLPLQWAVDVHSLHSPASFSFEANKEELEALRRYAGAEDVTHFKAHLKVAPLAAGKFRVTGNLKAEAVQASVTDLSAVPATIEEHYTLEYWPGDLIEDTGADTVSFDNDPPEQIIEGRILIGEFLCELFSLSLDPYPRKPGDTFEWNPPREEPRAAPFAELARLRQKKPDEG